MRGRPGRKRKASVDRHDCGKIRQPTAAEKEQEARSVVIAQRVERFGCSEGEARLSLMGFAHGRAFLSGKINNDQYAACEAFMGLRDRYMHQAGIRDTASPALEWSPPSKETHSHDNPEIERKWNDLMIEFDRCEDELARWAVESFCIRDNDAALTIHKETLSAGIGVLTAFFALT